MDMIAYKPIYHHFKSVDGIIGKPLSEKDMDLNVLYDPNTYNLLLTRVEDKERECLEKHVLDPDLPLGPCTDQSNWCINESSKEFDIDYSCMRPQVYETKLREVIVLLWDLYMDSTKPVVTDSMIDDFKIFFAIVRLRLRMINAYYGDEYKPDRVVKWVYAPATESEVKYIISRNRVFHDLFKEYEKEWLLLCSIDSLNDYGERGDNAGKLLRKYYYGSNEEKEDILFKDVLEHISSVYTKDDNK